MTHFKSISTAGFMKRFTILACLPWLFPSCTVWVRLFAYTLYASLLWFSVQLDIYSTSVNIDVGRRMLCWFCWFSLLMSRTRLHRLARRPPRCSRWGLCLQVHSPNILNEKCVSGVVRIGSVIIRHLSELWKAKFFILCDVIFLVRLQGKFAIDHSWK